MILVSICLLGVGYASITSVDLDLTGNASMDGQTGVVISEVSISDSHNINPNYSEINTYYQTLLNTRTELGNDSTSYITYEIEITNLTDTTQVYKGINYDPTYYDNADIVFNTIDLNVGDTIAAGQSKTVHLKFYYGSVQQSYANTVLNSIIEFEFESSQQVIDEKDYSGLCVFNGEGNYLSGDCTGLDTNTQGYINTGLALFSSTNYQNDF